jgi:hypothetical protein
MLNVLRNIEGISVLIKVFFIKKSEEYYNLIAVKNATCCRFIQSDNDIQIVGKK